MASKKLIAHISRGNVLNDLGFGPAEAAAVKMKAQRHSEIVRVIEPERLHASGVERAVGRTAAENQRLDERENFEV